MGDVCNECKRKRPTFSAARDALYAFLRSEGWTVVMVDRRTFKPLKVPYAIAPNGRFRFWFKPQAVWRSDDGTSVNEARSTHDDVRDYHPAAFVERNYRR